MTPPDSRNLEAVSDGGVSLSSPIDPTERRRIPRLSLSGTQFRLQANGKVFAVADLSDGGMALQVLDPADLVLFPVGMKLEGKLNLSGEKHRVTAKVRHLGTDLVGCEFEELEGTVRKALNQALSPASMGHELRLIPSSSQQGALWYHGPFGTDLLLWRDANGDLTRIRLFCLGQYIQWESADGLSTGRTRHSYEQSEMHGVVRFETMLLEPDSSPDSEKLEIAKTLILSSNVPEDLKRWCSSHFS